jgi:glycogen debranching enzyme
MLHVGLVMGCQIVFKKGGDNLSLHIVHSHNGKRADEHINKEAAFLITNKKGGYLSLGGNSFTHMQGLFFFDEDTFCPFKTVENIIIDRKIVGLRNSFSTVERVYGEGCDEEFTLINNAMCYTVKNYSGKIVLDLDFRRMFDYDGHGRIYSVVREDDDIIIKYDKYTDDSLTQVALTRFLVIKGASSYEAVNAWDQKEYMYDSRRGSKSVFYTYKAISIPCTGSISLVFSYGKTAEDAREQARMVHENKGYYLSSMRKYMTHTFGSRDLTADIASKAVDDLLMTVDVKSDASESKKRTGVFAGLPWFHQFWSRDEIVSLRALMIQGKYQLVKTIIFSYLDSLSDEGLLPNRLPHSEIKSIDSSGWLFVRIHDFLLELVSKKVVDKYLSESEIRQVRARLENAILGMTHNADGGFVKGALQESWMDTKEAKRSGAFIESQAFALAMMRLHNELARATRAKQLFIHLETEYCQKIKSAFFKDGKLLDTIGGEIPGEVSRPNVFLAYYIYPELLSPDEWKQVFDNSLKDLWLDWGGLSTIGHSTPYFKGEYTGESDASYHNGDSWFFVNNFAAIAMNRLDKNHYAKYINRIYHASREEMLFSGFVGACAEVSSAKELRSEGCLAQAWSAATFLELLHEMNGAK